MSQPPNPTLAAIKKALIAQKNVQNVPATAVNPAIAPAAALAAANQSPSPLFNQSAASILNRIKARQTGTAPYYYPPAVADCEPGDFVLSQGRQHLDARRWFWEIIPVAKVEYGNIRINRDDPLFVEQPIVNSLYTSDDHIIFHYAKKTIKDRAVAESIAGVIRPAQAEFLAVYEEADVVFQQALRDAEAERDAKLTPNYAKLKLQIALLGLEDED